MPYSDNKTINIYNCEENFSDKIFTSTVEFLYEGIVVIDKRNITFKNCQFKKGIFLNINTTYRNIAEINLVFENCIILENKHENITISKKNNQNIFISFHYCFIKDFELKDGIFTNITFNKSIIDRLVISDSDISVISIINSFGKFFINNNPHSYLTIYYTDDNLIIKNYLIRETNSFIVKRDSLIKIFQYKTYYYISNTKKINVEFKKTNKSGYSIIKNVDKSLKEARYYLKESDKDILDISISISLDQDIGSDLKVSNGVLKDISLSGFSNSKIEIKNTICNRFFIHEFGSSKLLLYNLTSNLIDSKFEILNSDLTNAWFNKVKLNSFEIVNFYRTTLEKTIFSATEFPENIESLENIHYPLNKESDYYNNLYENYKQLKISLSSQHNQIQALKMHSKMYESIRKSKTLSNQDRLILFLNNISNKHGISIKQSFFVFVVVIISLYTFYVLALPQAPYSFGWDSFGSYINSLKEILSFGLKQWKNFYTLLNPTHSLSQLIENNNGESISSMNYFISYISRILIGWIYYQFVSAFRKFSKTL